MNFLKRFWRWLVAEKPKLSTEQEALVQDAINKTLPTMLARALKAQSYDPSEDEMKILKGEVESYFE